MLTIPRDWLIGEWLLNWDAVDSSWNWFDATATDVTRKDDTAWYQKESAYVWDWAKIEWPDVEDLRIVWDVSYWAWVKVDDWWANWDWYQMIINEVDNWESLTTNVCYLVWVKTDSKKLYIWHEYWDWNNQFYEVDLYPPEWEWCHIFITRDINNKEYKVYLNWQYKLSQTYDTNPEKWDSDNTQRLCLWRDKWDSDWNELYWQICLARVYNRILSDQEIRALYLEWLRKLNPVYTAYPELFKWCVGYWDFRDGDLSNLITGEIATNNWTAPTTDHLWYANSARYFDDDDADNIQLWNWWYNFSNWESYTYVVIWKTINETDYDVFILDKNWDDDNHRWIWRNNDWQLRISRHDDDWDKQILADVWDFNDTFHFMACTYDWTTINAYRDWDNIWNDTPNWPIIADNVVALWCKWGSTDSDNLDWVISKVLIFNRALSDKEIKILHDLFMR